MIKKFLVLFIVLSLMVSHSVLGAAVAAAGDNKTVVSGALPEENTICISLQQERLRILDSQTLSDDEKEKALSKLAFMSLSEEERTELVTSQNSLNRRYKVVKSCDVPFFRQETSYWCGPAVTKQTIHYLTDGAISPSQTELASALGTTTAGSSSASMAAWLYEQGYYYYRIDVDTLDVQGIINYVATDLDMYDQPPFGAIAVNSTQVSTMDWYYTTNGHFINISTILQDSYSNDDCELEITDPYITYVRPEITSGKYYVAIGHYDAVKTSFWW